MSRFSLENKSILVTGASSGIGRAIAIAAAKMGASVYITARNEVRLEEVLLQLEGRGTILPADLTSRETVNSLVNALPKLHGVVHSAGVGHRQACKNITGDDLNTVFQLNTFAPILLQTALLQKKKLENAASIVFVASKAADFPSKANAVYSASKGAIISYAKCLGLELAFRKIRVNCISPAMVWTDLITSSEIDIEDLKLAEQHYPLKRYGQPEDIANLALYLLSDESSWMTGSNLAITGGARAL